MTIILFIVVETLHELVNLRLGPWLLVDEHKILDAV
jgi:hypothetical protein